LGKDPVKELSTGIALIGPNFTHSNKDQKQIYNYLTSGFTVIYISGMYPGNEQATDCIYNDMSLPALDEFTPVKPRFYM